MRIPPVLFCLFLLFSAARAAETLESIERIRALSPEQARRRLPVKVEAVVTYHNPAQPALLANDGKEGIYVSLPESLKGAYQPGTKLLISGVTEPGGFLPIIEAHQIEVLGTGTLPAPQRIDGNQLFSPALDCHWVQVPAIITGLEDSERMVLIAEVAGWTVKLLLPFGDEMRAQATRLMQQPVTVTGVVGSVFNSHRQLTGRHFFVPSFEHIVPTADAVPDTEPQLRAINELLRSDANSRTRVRVQAVVTHSTPESLFVRDEGGGLQVKTISARGIPPGTLVEVEGFAAVAPFRPVLRATKVTVLQQQEEPAARPIDLAGSLPTTRQADLGSLEADFLAQRAGSGSEVILQCRSGDWFFEASLMDADSASLPLGSGDRVRLTGVCEFTSSRELPFSGNADGFRLHLRDVNDVAVLKHAPWWTLSRLLWALGGVGGIALAALAWVASLRRKVVEQTRIIGAQIERAAVKDERQRIARELHDTIEQELAGVSLQIRNVRQRFAQAPELAGPSLDLAERMVRHCREEARSSIRDLRSVTLEQRGLCGALQEFLEPIATECGARFTFEVEGEPQPLPGPGDIHLLRIANEAVVNAARHASPNEIRVWLSYERNMVMLEVRDDGCGFNSSAPPPRGHFGLTGIAERANKLNAAYTVESAPGSGTTVRVMVPVTPAFRPEQTVT